MFLWEWYMFPWNMSNKLLHNRYAPFIHHSCANRIELVKSRILELQLNFFVLSFLFTPLNKLFEFLCQYNHIYVKCNFERNHFPLTTLYTLYITKYQSHVFLFILLYECDTWWVVRVRTHTHTHTPLYIHKHT